MSKKRDNEQKDANVQRTSGPNHQVSQATEEHLGIKSQTGYQSEQGGISSVADDMKASREDAIETQKGFEKTQR